MKVESWENKNSGGGKAAGDFTPEQVRDTLPVFSQRTVSNCLTHSTVSMHQSNVGALFHRHVGC